MDTINTTVDGKELSFEEVRAMLLHDYSHPKLKLDFKDCPEIARKAQEPALPDRQAPQKAIAQVSVIPTPKTEEPPAPPSKNVAPESAVRRKSILRQPKINNGTFLENSLTKQTKTINRLPLSRKQASATR
jgi:hypothetical protein